MSCGPKRSRLGCYLRIGVRSVDPESFFGPRRPPAPSVNAPAPVSDWLRALAAQPCSCGTKASPSRTTAANPSAASCHPSAQMEFDSSSCTLEDTFDCFVESAVHRRCLSSAALDRFTDHIAGRRDEEQRQRAIGTILKKFLKPGKKIVLEDYPYPLPRFGDINGICGTIIGDEAYARWVPRSYTILMEPEDGDASVQLKVAPQYLRPLPEDEYEELYRFPWDPYDSPVEEDLPRY